MSGYINGVRRCFYCGSPEYCFKKTYKNGDLLAHNPNEFWICQNEKCGYYIKIDVGKEIYIATHQEKFTWYLAHITETNIETYNIYNETT